PLHGEHTQLSYNCQQTSTALSVSRNKKRVSTKISLKCVKFCQISTHFLRFSA
ncbi:hypothetical protein pipiens_011573, partial [Culex pipiens pipiens]